ncbi:MAG: sodium:proton antiporter NhaD, partial [Pseudomonadales bacterium]
VVAAVGGSDTKFVAVGCINIVVAANSGGAFSPFGDITTLMVWQAGLVEFQEFFALFIPSVVNWIVTAGILSFAISNEKPDPLEEKVSLKFGAWIVVALFIMTIAMAVSFHNFLHLPPVLGIMSGLGILKLFGYYLQISDSELNKKALEDLVSEDDAMFNQSMQPDFELKFEGKNPYDIYINLQRAEWDTLIFFYGIILCVGGLGAFGYLVVVSEFMYIDLGPTAA